MAVNFAGLQFDGADVMNDDILGIAAGEMIPAWHAYPSTFSAPAKQTPRDQNSQADPLKCCDHCAPDRSADHQYGTHSRPENTCPISPPPAPHRPQSSNPPPFSLCPTPQANENWNQNSIPKINTLDRWASTLLWNGIKPLSYLSHLIIVWSCGHYYKIQGWTHVGHMVNTLISFHLIHNAAYTCLSFYLLCIAVQCLTCNACRTFQNYLHKNSMECLTDNTCSLFSIYSLSNSILVL